MIIYIHGFGGSGEGVKAKICREFFTDETILTPSLSYVPELAISTLINLIEAIQKHELVYLIGSSLGGYYALYLSQKFNLKAVLINPSIYPYDTLGKLTGYAPNFYDQSQFEWTEKHIKMLHRFEVKSIRIPSDILLMVQTGDELLDYRHAVNKLPEVQQVIEKGGSHSFDGFEDRLFEIKDFFKRV